MNALSGILIAFIDRNNLRRTLSSEKYQSGERLSSVYWCVQNDDLRNTINYIYVQHLNRKVISIPGRASE
jgi:hypothetical protein